MDEKEEDHGELIQNIQTYALCLSTIKNAVIKEEK